MLCFMRLLGLSVLLAACGYEEYGAESAEYLTRESAIQVAGVRGAEGGSADMRYKGGARAKQVMASRSVADAPEPVPVPSKRLVIQRGELRLEVEAAEDWMAQVAQRVEEHGGFIAQSSKEEGRQNVQSGRMTLRVPAASFEALLDALKGHAVKVEGEERSGEDITEQFYDLEVRLANQKHTEKRFLAILQKADKVEDILRVERELSRVREAIEQMEGRKRFWQDRVSLATVTVAWHEPYPLIGGQPGLGFWGVVGEGFERGFRGLSRGMRDLIAFAIGGLPIFVLLGLGGWGWLRWRRKRRDLV